MRILIIGAGPAGLTAARELVRHGFNDLVIWEATRDIGGISKTVNHEGNRIDIGGHRFFSKSDWVMNWWQEVLPVESTGQDLRIRYQNKDASVNLRPVHDQHAGGTLLVRPRLSRIFFEGKFFPYPLKADAGTALKLGLPRVTRMGLSYLRARLRPRRPEVSLEDFMVNRFGRVLYETFFKGYTEKVWGVRCTQISAEWGAQRIKGLSIGSALAHAAKAPFRRLGIGGAATNTSLIEQFLYPQLGPGQMWETVAHLVQQEGADLRLGLRAERFELGEAGVTCVVGRDDKGREVREQVDHVISTMPVKELIAGLGEAAPATVRDVAAGLEYRDFITVGLLLRKLQPSQGAITGSKTNQLPDNWIYIQDRGVNVGRLQIFNNWSPHLVKDEDTVWIGMEYFCREDDDLWNRSDADLAELASRELEDIGLAQQADVLDSVTIRMPKAYPGYYGTYDRFAEIRTFTDSIPNLFLVGRNGMHRYNNQDHSMLTARYAVEAIMSGSSDKSRIWEVNVDDDYHETAAEA